MSKKHALIAVTFVCIVAIASALYVYSHREPEPQCHFENVSVDHISTTGVISGSGMYVCDK